VNGSKKEKQDPNGIKSTMLLLSMDGDKPKMELSTGIARIVGVPNGVKMETLKCSEEMTQEELKVWVRLLCLMLLI